MKAYGLYESASVKIQTLKTAVEVSSRLPTARNARAHVRCSQAARVLLRVDDVVQAKRQDREGGGGGGPPEEKEG